ncbi:MAG: hypothetical protein K940chlam4_01119 [Candidatus Anoxychlamydiales bacterium]|nr:hypothetical protein [Candidatus Anoxychlamydiales bacterium]
MSSAIASLTTINSREEKLFVDIGETTVCSGLAYLGAKTLTVINPMSAAIFMGSVWGISAIARRIFKNSPNKDGIVFAFNLGALIVVASSVGITFLNGLLIEAITLLALGSLKYLHRNIL